MRVAISGAGNVGQSIAAELLDEGHQVVLIEKEPRIVSEAKRRLPTAEFLTADACEVRALAPACLETADAAIAATGEDQVNLVFSLLASQEFGVPRVVARVNDPRNGWLFTEGWGVDVAVSTPSLLASNALQAVGSGAMVRLQSLQGGAVHLCALEVMEGHPVRDKTVGALDLPQGALVVSIVREGIVVPPDPDQIIGIGDEIFLMTEAHLENEVARALLGEAHLMGDVIEPLPLGDL